MRRAGLRLKILHTCGRRDGPVGRLLRVRLRPALEGEIQILKDKGYNGTVSLELFNKELWAKDPAEVLKVGYERMRELLG